jgi:predicted  nucleic acid-binding Zn-ribbon protein
MNIGRIPQEHLGKLQEVLRIQEDLSIITKDLQQKNDEVTKLTGAQARIRENIKVSSPGTDDHRNFSAKLRESENAIESLTNKTMPELQEKQKITTRHLNEALKGLSFVWNNNQQGRNE